MGTPHLSERRIKSTGCSFARGALCCDTETLRGKIEFELWRREIHTATSGCRQADCSKAVEPIPHEQCRAAAELGARYNFSRNSKPLTNSPRDIQPFLSWRFYWHNR